MISRIKASAQAVAELGELRAGESTDAIAAYVVGVVLGPNAMARPGEKPEIDHE